MSSNNEKKWFNKLSNTFIKDENALKLNEYKLIVKQIRGLKNQFSVLSDFDLKIVFKKAGQKFSNDDKREKVYAEIYAIINEVIIRRLKIKPYDVQLIGAVALQNNHIIEMPTGEGKTLVAVFPAILNALSGKGVHILTFNDYLAERDANWMKVVYEFLGMSVGFVKEGMLPEVRHRAYHSDITYLSAKEAGFDFLRDSMCVDENDIVQRDYHFAIIDEADSILIDEARIPLVIAGSSDEQLADTQRVAQVARQLHKDTDYEFDTYQRNFHLTSDGAGKSEQLLDCGNIYDAENYELLTKLNCAIHAKSLLQNGVDYIIRENKIELIDAFTGRVADKRRWPDGIQAALEAKENLIQQKQGQILNSISLQHFINLYPNICGMTGTAALAAKELKRFYEVDVLVIPANKPCIREDLEDIIFLTKKEKEQAIVQEIIKSNQVGRPVLVGTVSVNESERLAGLLKEAGLNCEILNARNDHDEAKIISQAGRLGAITISTNMAGRGTDIRLGGADENEKQKVENLSGLYVIGTNRHESRRIDNQLRGRAGRQGESGSSRFFISLEDDIFKRYKLDELLPQNLLSNHKNYNKILNREINRVQRIVEGQNLEIKKTLLKYSSLVDKQREILFEKRQAYLNTDNCIEFFRKGNLDNYKILFGATAKDKFATLAKTILLYFIDQTWLEHLAFITELRESIHLNRIGGKDPLFEFQKIVIQRFDEIFEQIESDALKLFSELSLADCEQILNGERLKRPSATWTYLVNDNPFENAIGLEMIANIGMQAGAGIYAVAYSVINLFKKVKKSAK